jgi:hypothetical protein
VPLPLLPLLGAWVADGVAVLELSLDDVDDVVPEVVVLLSAVLEDDDVPAYEAAAA